jgi:hypothetical protein
MGYLAGKAAPGTPCPPGHSMAYCNGYVTGAGNTPIVDTHCDKSNYPSCYSLGYQAGKNAALGTPCPSGHSLNYCSGWEAGNTGTGTPPKCTISVKDASYTTQQNIPTPITLTEQDSAPCTKPITISIVSEPKHGDLKPTGAANQYTYTPNTGFNGTDSSQYQASDNNGTKSNVGTVSVLVGSTPQHKLVVHIQVAKDPIVRGNNQTITVTVGDDTGRKVVGADVQGEVLYVSGFIHTFSGITDNKGQVIYGWRISGDADTGQFKVTVVATATGYEKGSATNTFTVIPKTQS